MEKNEILLHLAIDILWDKTPIKERSPWARLIPRNDFLSSNAFTIYDADGSARFHIVDVHDMLDENLMEDLMDILGERNSAEEMVGHNSESPCLFKEDID